MQTTMSMTFSGKNFDEVIAQAKAFIEQEDGTTTTGKTTPRKTKPAVEAEQLDLLDSTEETEEETNELSFDDGNVEEEEEVTAKPAKGAPKKYTDKDVNQAAIKHAKANGGKAKTLKILEKKFGVKSILELKPTQYGQVIAALKVD